MNAGVPAASRLFEVLPAGLSSCVCGGCQGVGDTIVQWNNPLLYALVRAPRCRSTLTDGEARMDSSYLAVSSAADAGPTSWPSTSSSLTYRTASVDGLKIFYRQAGPDD